MLKSVCLFYVFYSVRLVPVFKPLCKTERQVSLTHLHEDEVFV